MTEKTLVMVEIVFAATSELYKYCQDLVWGAIKVKTEVANSLKVEHGEWLCSQHCLIHHD